jgi:hypothetical protein
MEKDAVNALRQCLDALREVQPQVRGALPANSVRWAIERAEVVLSEYACECGAFAGVGQVYCEDCDLERTGGEE